MTPHPIYDATVTTWCAEQVARIAAPLRRAVGMDNPLAYGHRCAKCGTFLDKPERPCPMGCGR